MDAGDSDHPPVCRRLWCADVESAAAVHSMTVMMMIGTIGEECHATQAGKKHHPSYPDRSVPVPWYQYQECDRLSASCSTKSVCSMRANKQCVFLSEMYCATNGKVKDPFLYPLRKNIMDCSNFGGTTEFPKKTYLVLWRNIWLCQ